MTSRSNGAPSVGRGRPNRYVWVGIAAAAFLFAYGALEGGEFFTSTAGRVAWLVGCVVFIAVLLIPARRAELVVSQDGRLTRRWLRSVSVDLTDLVAIHTRGDHPWSTHPSGVLTFVDREGRRVDVELIHGAWGPRAIFEALIPHIERSGLPLSGIVARQLEEKVHRRVHVIDANRRAHDETRAALRRGHLRPHRARGGRMQVGLTILAASLPALLIWAAGRGMVPPDHVGRWQAGFAAVTAVLLLAAAYRYWLVLELDERARVSVHGPGLPRRGVDLRRLASVELAPDQPYLERTVNGRLINGRKVPSLVLRDASGDTLRVRLGAQWQGQVPILRAVLAAADERDVPLSQHARYELEFRVGLVPGPPWVGEEP